MNKKHHISVVIPVYNGAGCLAALYDRLRAALEKIDPNFQIIFVNDASPDDAWTKIGELAAQDQRVTGLNLSRNFGQHPAITAGLDAADGEWVVVMDCDLQDQPEEIEKMYAAARQGGYDVVFGRRVAREDTFFKKLGSKLFYMVLSYLTGMKQDPAIANFGVFHYKVIDAIGQLKENLRYFPLMVKWVGFRSTAIEIDHGRRYQGKTSYSLGKLTNLAIDVILAFSEKPLRLFVKLGIGISIASLGFAVYYLIRALSGTIPVEGWTSLILSVWLLSGIIIILLGIVGSYIGKTFNEVKKRPIYVIRERCGA